MLNCLPYRRTPITRIIIRILLVRVSRNRPILGIHPTYLVAYLIGPQEPPLLLLLQRLQQLLVHLEFGLLAGRGEEHHVRRQSPVVVTRMGLDHPLLLLSGVLGDLLVGLAVGALGLVLPEGSAESESGGAAPVAEDAGKYDDGGEHLVGDVPQAVGGDAVRVDAAMADVLSVALDVDGVAG